MAEIEMDSKEFQAASRQATQRALQGRVDAKELEKFLLMKESGKGKTIKIEGGQGPAEAKGETYTVVLYGYVKCTPTNLDHVFEANHWGLGLDAISAYGTMFTAYDSWDAFFNEVKGYHAQGIASGGGILQITWFNGSGVPVGQFDGAAGGIGVFEVGGEGRWTRK